LHFKEEEDKETRLHNCCPIGCSIKPSYIFGVLYGLVVYYERQIFIIDPANQLYQGHRWVDRLVNTVAERLVE
jgi:hypothetical protein